MLPAFDILHRAGFRDVQNLAFEWWGQPIAATCKNSTRKDFLYISPEMQQLLRGVEIHNDVWPDHVVLSGKFCMPSSAIDTWTWPKPKPMPWPTNFGGDIAWNHDLPPIEAYQQLWAQIETSACLACPYPVPNSMKGRAQRILPKKLKPCTPSPVKVGRHGDFQPGFFGCSVQYAHWVRQVRRLQAFCRLQTSQAEIHIQIAESWGAILRAKGFEHSFSF